MAGIGWEPSGRAEASNTAKRTSTPTNAVATIDPKQKTSHTVALCQGPKRNRAEVKENQSEWVEWRCKMGM
jgi:hypothetical protein